MKRETRKPQPDDALIAVDDEGNPVDKKILEDAGIAFDPTAQHLDLTKDEKRRTTALMMAIQAYNNLIIKDAEMFMAVNRESAHKSELTIRPATMNAMVEAAIHFDMFIAGKFDGLANEQNNIITGGIPSEAQPEETQPA